MRAAPVVRLNSIQDRYLARVQERLAAGAYRLETVAECLCGSTASQSLADHDRFGLPVGVVACEHCGLARTSPRLAGQDLDRFYDDDYHGLHMGIPDPSPSAVLYRHGQGRAIYQFVRSELHSNPVRVAEIGCGTGQVLREFARRAESDSIRVEVIGCEYASAYVEAGRSAGTVIIRGSAEALAPHGPFDLVILSHVFEHFPEPLRDIQPVIDLLSPSGVAYVEVPGILAIHEKPEYLYEFRQYLTLAHMYHYSRTTLARAMWLSGLEVIRADEHVRMVLRRNRSGAAPVFEPQFDKLIGYLAWLDGSRWVRAKRHATRAYGVSKRAALSVLRPVLGESHVAALKAALRSLRI